MNSKFIFLLALFLLISLVLAFIPYLTRKTENFGVSIPEAFYHRNDFKAMRKKYAVILMLIGFLLGTGFFLLATRLNTTSMHTIYTVMLFTYIIAGFLIYLPFHLKMKKVKENEDWQTERKQSVVVDIKFRQEKLIYSNWWFLTSAIFILVTIAITFIFYDSIPDKIPMHTDISGNVTYEDKSIGNLLFLPGTQVFILGLFIFLNFIIKNTKQQVSVENPEKSKQQNIVFRRRWSAFLIWSGALIQLLLLFLQLTLIFPSLIPYEDPILFTIVIIIILGVLILAFTTGQGGSRVKLTDHFDENVIDRDDDRYWILGQFYANKNDPAIFVEKRFGVGWTNNWAHPLSWIIVGAIILVIVIPLIFFM